MMAVVMAFFVLLAARELQYVSLKIRMQVGDDLACLQNQSTPSEAKQVAHKGLASND